MEPITGIRRRKLIATGKKPLKDRANDNNTNIVKRLAYALYVRFKMIQM